MKGPIPSPQSTRSSADCSAEQGDSCTETPAAETCPWAPDAVNLGRRIGTQVNLLIRHLPLSVREARAMSEYLGIDRGTAQRVVSTARCAQDGAAVLTKMPGERGLVLFSQAARRMGLEEALVDNLLGSAKAYAEFLRRSGLRHSTLQEAMKLSPAHGGGEPMKAPPRTSLDRYLSAAFRTCRNIAGASTALKFSTGAIRVCPTNPKLLEIITASARLGNQRHPGGMPHVVNFALHQHSTEEGGTSNPPDRAPELLKEFSSADLRLDHVHGPRGEITSVLRPTSMDDRDAMDVVVIDRVRQLDHPGLSSNRCMNMIVKANLPVRRIVRDVYVHHSVELEDVPYLTGMCWTQHCDGNPLDNWFDHVPGVPPIKLLGRGLVHAESEAWARAGELTRLLFHRVGWNANEFVGYRGDVKHPIWHVDYALTFPLKPVSP